MQMKQCLEHLNGSEYCLRNCLISLFPLRYLRARNDGEAARKP